MDREENDRLREVFRKYKRAAWSLRKAENAVEPDAKITFHANWGQGKGGSSSFDEYPMLIRLAALLRPFMNEASPVELRSVWGAIKASGIFLPDETRDVMERNFIAVEALGGMALELNGRELKASDIYFAYAEGMFFDKDPEAKKLLKLLSWGPGAHLVQFLFHTVCTNFSQLVFELLKVILAVERNTSSPASEPTEAQCIYCLDRDGHFGDEEHVIPEAFGVDDLILTNGACRKCKLSDLDQYLAEFEPIAMLRVQNVPLTKKGKFPRVDTRDFTMEKIKPRLIRVIGKNGSKAFAEELLPDGRLKLTLKTVTKPLDSVRLARAVFKIGLGVVALHAGIAYACEPRFDAARAFINGTGVMPNHLLMVRQPEIRPVIETSWHPELPTIFYVSFWGLWFAVNLESLPLQRPLEVPIDSILAFWLGDVSKSGVVDPCLGDCSHHVVQTVQPFN